MPPGTLTVSPGRLGTWPGFADARPLPARPTLARWCVPPPPAVPGVCRVCHGPSGEGFDRCWSCSVVGRALGSQGDSPPVVPISISTPGSALQRVLVAYKSSRDPSERAFASADLAQLIAAWLAWHGRCLARSAGGGWDVIDVVPSTRRSGPVHPLSGALQTLPALASRVVPLLSLGRAGVGHLDPSADAFAVRASAAGARVLLLDDVFTTGAHALSAAAALRRAGAFVVAVVPVGRLVHAECWPGSEWWARFYAHGGRPAPNGVDSCALEPAGPRRRPTTRASSAAWPRRNAAPARGRPASPTPPRRAGLR